MDSWFRTQRLMNDGRHRIDTDHAGHTIIHVSSSDDQPNLRTGHVQEESRPTVARHQGRVDRLPRRLLERRRLVGPQEVVEGRGACRNLVGRVREEAVGVWGVSCGVELSGPRATAIETRALYVLAGRGGEEDGLEAVQDVVVVVHADGPHLDHVEPPAVAAVGNLFGRVWVWVWMPMRRERGRRRKAPHAAADPLGSSCDLMSMRIGSITCLGEEGWRVGDAAAELGLDDDLHQELALGRGHQPVRVVSLGRGRERWGSVRPLVYVNRSSLIDPY